MENDDDLPVDGNVLTLNGEVVSEEMRRWWGSGISADLVRRGLAAIDGPAIVMLNSYGGLVHEGEQIRMMFAERGDVTVRVVGVSMSIASLMMLGAERIEISAGSQVMIHDPSTLVWGTQEELEREADALGRLADQCAGIYARRSGQDVATIRQMLRDETYFSADEAVDAGFADAIYEPESDGLDEAIITEAAAETMFLQRMRAVASAHMQFRGSGRTTAALAAQQKGPIMEPETQPAAPAAQATPPAPAAPVAAVTPPAASAPQAPAPNERTRRAAIRSAAYPHVASGVITQQMVDGWIDDPAVTADAASAQILAALTAQPHNQPITAAGAPVITRDEVDTRIDAMSTALASSLTAGRIEAQGPAAEYRNLTPRRLAMELAGNPRGFNDFETVQAGMRSTTMMGGGAIGTSDFSLITANTVNRILAERMRVSPGTWRPITRDRPTTDFKPVTVVNYGADFEMKRILENGEYEQGTVSDEGNTVKAVRYGREIKWTLEAIMNDDLGAFAEAPEQFADAYASLESRLAWELITGNATLNEDGKAVAMFHNDRGNNGTAALSAEALGVMFAAMMEQRVYGTKPADNAFTSTTPTHLYTSPTLNFTARQLMGSTNPSKDADVNPYKGDLEVVGEARLGAAASGGSNTAWYGFSALHPVLSRAVVQGLSEPVVRPITPRDPDSVVLNARAVTGFAATGARAYRSTGAG